MTNYQFPMNDEFRIPNNKKDIITGETMKEEGNGGLAIQKGR